MTGGARNKWRRPFACFGLVGAIMLASAASAEPRIDYTLHCRGCHGPEGAGVPGAAPALRGQVARFLAVPGGREYLVQVPGTAQSELDDTHVASLLNWILHEFSRDEMPADFVPYTADEVGRLRHSPLTDVEAVRRALMAAMPSVVAELPPDQE